MNQDGQTNVKSSYDETSQSPVDKRSHELFEGMRDSKEYSAMTDEEKSDVFGTSARIPALITKSIAPGKITDLNLALTLAKTIMDMTTVWPTCPELDSTLCCARILGTLSRKRGERMTTSQIISLMRIMSNQEEMDAAKNAGPVQFMAWMRGVSERTKSLCHALFLLGYIRDVDYEDGTFLFVEPRPSQNVAAFFDVLVATSHDALVDMFFDKATRELDGVVDIDETLRQRRTEYVEKCFPKVLAPFCETAE